MGSTTIGSQTNGSRQMVPRQMVHDNWFSKKRFIVKLMKMLIVKLKWDVGNANIVNKQSLDETNDNVDDRTRSADETDESACS